MYSLSLLFALYDQFEAQLIIPYVRKTLDVLGVKNGPSHGEVIITETGPCLVEMNCRANGGDGAWQPLARGLTPGGYSQVEVTADAYLNPERFASYPDIPGPLVGQGVEVNLVSYGTGIVQRTPGFDVLKKLPSCIHFESGIEIGSKVDLTIDLITSVGSVIVYHENPAIVKDDLHIIRYLENMNGLFIFEEEEESQKQQQQATNTTAASHRRHRKTASLADVTVSSATAKETTTMRQAKELDEEKEDPNDNRFPDAPFLQKTISIQKTVDLDTQHDRFHWNADGPPTMLRTVSLQKTLGHRRAVSGDVSPTMLRTLSLQKQQQG